MQYLVYGISIHLVKTLKVYNLQLNTIIYFITHTSQCSNNQRNVLNHKCSVVSVTKYFLEVMIWKSIWDDTLGRNHIIVTSVTNLSLKELILKSISEHTLERSHLDAVSAIKHSQEMLNLKSTWGHNLGKSHINVTSVPNLSLK